MERLVGLFVLFSVCYGYGQEIIGIEQEGYKQIDAHSLYTTDYSYHPEAKWVGVIGSPFINNRFEKGIVTIGEKVHFTALMRYNADREVIEYVAGNKRIDLSRRPYITAEFDGRKFEILEYLDSGKKKLGYFNPLMTSGAIQLLYRPKKKIIKESKSLSGNDHSSYNFNAYCVDVSSYYLKEGNNPARKIDLGEDGLFMHLDDKSGLLRRYVESKKLNLKKEDDAIRLLEYFNAINNPRGEIYGTIQQYAALPE